MYPLSLFYVIALNLFVYCIPVYSYKFYIWDFNPDILFYLWTCWRSSASAYQVHFDAVYNCYIACACILLCIWSYLKLFLNIQKGIKYFLKYGCVIVQIVLTMQCQIKSSYLVIYYMIYMYSYMTWYTCINLYV